MEQENIHVLQEPAGTSEMGGGGGQGCSTPTVPEASSHPLLLHTAQIRRKRQSQSQLMTITTPDRLLDDNQDPHPPNTHKKKKRKH